jgi:hypothetical protein
VGRGCLLARLAEARGLSGLHQLPEMSLWPGVIGARGEPEDRPSVRLGEARGLFGLHRLPEMSPWLAVIGAGREPEVVSWRGPVVCPGFSGCEKCRHGWR